MRRPWLQHSSVHELDRLDRQERRRNHLALVVFGVAFCALIGLLLTRKPPVRDPMDGAVLGLHPSPERRADRGGDIRLKVQLSSGEVVGVTAPRGIPVISGAPVRVDRSRKGTHTFRYRFQQYLPDTRNRGTHD